MKNRLIVWLAGLSLGVLTGCTAVPADGQQLGEPAQVDPKTNTAFCYDCPVEAGHVESQSTRTPVLDPVTGMYACLPCGDEELGYCGDGICNGSEYCGSCSDDCGTCAPSTWCGDGTCNGGETSASCPGDCPITSGVVLGRFSRYCGKVNSHTDPSGAWTWDSDCTSGCNIGGLSYCQKFWPNSVGIRQVSVSAKPNTAWARAGCIAANDDWDGGDEFECLVD